MKQLIVCSFLLLLISFLSVGHAWAQCGLRYYNKIFNTEIQSGIQYGRNAKHNGDTIDLLMDVYLPENDTLSKRPLMVLAFGGSFTFGSRLSPDIVTLCNEFSQRGYVCAAIDYRLGFENNNDSDTNQLKALFRGVQDMRAAIRYFYKDASGTNQYRIDTNQIFAGGTSAGAFIALNHAYFKFGGGTRPVPQWAVDALIEIGGVDGFSGNPGYSSKVKGVINLCGAIADTSWIQPGDPIIVSVHGTADALVPFYYDSTQSSQSVEAMFFGSGDIHNRANHIGLINFLKPFYGADHVPFVILSNSQWQKYMDTTIWTIRDFLYQNLECNNTSVDPLNTIQTVHIFPNPSSGIIKIQTENISDATVVIFDMQGNQALKSALSDNLSLNVTHLHRGIYLLTVYENSSGNFLLRKKILLE